MKKLVVLFVAVCLVLLSACSGDAITDKSGTEPSKKPILTNSYTRYKLGVESISAIRIYHDLFTEFLISEKQNSIAEAIQDKFDLATQFYSLDFPINKASISRLNGIVCLNWGNFIGNIPVFEECVVPLNDIVNKQEINEIVPSYLLHDLKDNNGLINYLPSTLTFQRNVRLYNSTIVEEFNLRIPHNLEEFIQLLSDIKDSDYNDNIIIVDSNKPLFEFQDIFSAYGFILDGSYRAINWCNETESYEDITLLEGFNNALQFIENIRNLDVIAFKEGSTREIYNNNRLLTRTLDSFRGTDEAYYTYSFSDSTVEPIRYNASPYYYIVPNSTENADEILTNFIATFLGNVSGNLYGTFGVNNAYADYSDPKIVKFIPDSHEVPFLMTGQWVTTNSYIQPTINSSEGSIMKRSISHQEIVQWILDGIDSGTIRTVPIWPDFRIMMLRDETYDSVFKNMFYEFLTSDMKTEDFLAAYHNSMNTMGAQEYIDKLNEAIGSITHYSY